MTYAILTDFIRNMAISGMAIFFIFGVDLALGGRFIGFLNKFLNRRYDVDGAIANTLNKLKQGIDKEINTDSSLSTGWGRFVLSGLLIFGGLFMMLSVLPQIR